MSTPTAQQFRLPDVGEGLTEAEIVVWHVAVGDTVTVNQVIVEIETAKSVVELPSPFAGVVLEIQVPEGATADVGTPIITIGAEDAPRPEQDVEAEEPKLLVGYGSKATEHRRPRRSGRGSGPIGTSHVAAPVADPVTGPVQEPPVKPAEDPDSKPRAKPPVRKLARVLGIDLARVVATGPDGTVARADVMAAAAQQADAAPASATGAGDDGRETRIPIKGVRKHTAAAMVASAFTAPHVTEFVTIDVTKTLELRALVQRRPGFREVRLSPLAFVARAYLRALARTPMATARWDDAAQEIVVPGAVNLGIAAATPRGLVVPNIKDAGTLDLLGLATAINDLAATARAGRSTPESMSGGTTTITNVGVFGVDTGTPILNPGESAILAVGAIRRLPWVVDRDGAEVIEPRSVLQLALSFDHRVIDGQQGSEVLADTAAVLAEPGMGLL